MWDPDPGIAIDTGELRRELVGHDKDYVGWI